jgi:hypothetical protein
VTENLDELREALADDAEMDAAITERFNVKLAETPRLIREAARSYLALMEGAIRLDYCTKHEAPRFKDYPWCHKARDEVAAAPGVVVCSMIPKLLIGPDTQPVSKEAE